MSILTNEEISELLREGERLFPTAKRVEGPTKFLEVTGRDLERLKEVTNELESHMIESERSGDNFVFLRGPIRRFIEEAKLYIENGT